MSPISVYSFWLVLFQTVKISVALRDLSKVFETDDVIVSQAYFGVLGDYKFMRNLKCGL